VSLTPKMFDWLGQALKENLPAVEAERARRIEALRRDQNDIRERMKQAYIDNVDGKIDDDLFTRLTADYRDDERQPDHPSSPPRRAIPRNGYGQRPSRSTKLSVPSNSAWTASCVRLKTP
jgi:hypothetical protein